VFGDVDRSVRDNLLAQVETVRLRWTPKTGQPDKV
jgi:hypothetical protein